MRGVLLVQPYKSTSSESPTLDEESTITGGDKRYATPEAEQHEMHHTSYIYYGCAVVLARSGHAAGAPSIHGHVSTPHTAQHGLRGPRTDATAPDQGEG